MLFVATPPQLSAQAGHLRNLRHIQLTSTGQTVDRPRGGDGCGWSKERPLMPRHDPALEDAIREIAALLAEACLRLLLGKPAVDFPETESPHVTGG